MESPSAQKTPRRGTSKGSSTPVLREIQVQPKINAFFKSKPEVVKDEEKKAPVSVPLTSFYQR